MWNLSAELVFEAQRHEREVQVGPPPNVSGGTDARGGSGVDPPHGRRRTRRVAAGIVLGLVLVLGVVALAITPLGWWGGPVGGDARPAIGPSAPSPTITARSGVPGGDRLALLGPDDGAMVLGSSLELRGVATGPLGRVHAEVEVGAVVLGAADALVESAGPFGALIPLARTGVTGRAYLRVWVGEGSAATVLVRSLWLCPTCA